MRVSGWLRARARPFFVSTPIFYVNAAPHIGHMYSAIVADTVQRFQRITDDNCNIIFSSGTDEHGSKIQNSAAKHNQTLQTYCNDISQRYQDLFKEFNVEYTDFVRTTEERHKKAVHHFWNELKERDYIYKTQYSGWYSVSDENFVPETLLREETRDGQTVKVSAESGHPVEWTEESNYMFRLSAFREHLQAWLSKDNVITPNKFQVQLREMVFGDSYLPDISVSRPTSRVHWAILVPDDSEQSIYVWLDALVNYLTTIGYPDIDHMNRLGRPWPADLHVLGKDILKFHGIYWPAFLMAVGLHPPRRLLCHSHWTVDGQKMSKSLGNVVDPRSTPGGTEALRYFLLREGTMHSDANFSETKLIRVINSELADTLGNLLGRCVGDTLNPRQEFPQLHQHELRRLRDSDVVQRLFRQVEELSDICLDFYSDYRFYKVVDSVMAALHTANLFFETLKPWELRKNTETQKELDVTLHITMETLRICAIILHPIIPHMTTVLLDKLQIPKENRRWRHTREISWNSGVISETQRIQTEKIVLFQRYYPEKNVKVSEKPVVKKKKEKVNAR